MALSEKAMPSSVEDLTTPAFLVDIDVAHNNAAGMIDRCQKMGVKLRPHMKTHKTWELGESMTAGTKRSIVVSTLAEAEFFADGGFDDILYAFIFTLDKIPRMKALAQRLSAFHVLLDSAVGLQYLIDNRLDGDQTWSVYLKVDCGYKRAGVPWDSGWSVSLARLLQDSEGVSFQGIYTHEGGSYSSTNEQEIHAAGAETVDRLLAFSASMKDVGVTCNVVAMGSTPTCSNPDDKMKMVTEFHPGNYIFYDAMQTALGSCKLDDVAVVVATRVVGVYPHRNQLLIDCGWLGLSLDGHGALPGGSYCIIKDEPNLKLVDMKQEAGIIEPAEGTIDFDKYSIGTILYLYPYHSCATAAMHPIYHVHRAGKIIAQWRPCRGW